jgi:hypothetical protein
MFEPQAQLAHIVRLEDLVIGSNPVDIKNQPANIICRKTSPASLAGVNFQKTSALKKPVSSANEHALLRADLFEQLRSYASAHCVFAEGGQWGRLPWR